VSASLEKGCRLELSIDGVGVGAEGVGHALGRAVFVPFVLPDERWLVEISHVGKRRVEARAIEGLAMHPERVEPVCPAFGRCGGCQLQHATYSLQLKLKQRLVADTLRSVAAVELDGPVPVMGADLALGYRNRGQYPVRLEGGRVRTGFFAPRSHELVAVESCPLHDERVDRVVGCMRAWAGRKQIDIYDEGRHQGFLRHAVARVAVSTGQVLAVCVGAKDSKLPHADLLRRLRRDLPELVGLVLNIQPQRSNVVLGKRNRLLWGQDFIEERLGGLRFRLSVGSFFQVHLAQAERLFARVGEILGKPERTVLDAYGGVGVLAQLLAAAGHETLGIEMVPQAVTDARTAAKGNGLSGMRFELGRVERVLPKLVRGGLRLGAVVLDPPRKGCAPEVLQAIADSGAGRIVYASCHPGSLARDLGRLFEMGFSLDSLEAVDMFPQTAHLECLASLSRR